MSGRKPRTGKQALRTSHSGDRPSAGRARDLILAAGIVAVIFIVYAGALHGDFIWDDDRYVSENETLRSLAGLRAIWLHVGATPQYYPLVFTTFWVEHHAFGDSPVPYHVVNVLLHALAAVLVWRIGKRLGVPGALAGALVFGLHPVHVESVAWITERKNVLSGFFYLAAMLAFLRFRPPGESDSRPSKPAWYALSLLFFLAALFSKTVTATLPGALLLVYWWKSGRLALRNVVAVAPMVAIGAFAGSLTAWVEKHHVGTEQIDLNLGALDRVLIAGRAVWFYLGKLVWPAPLTFIYPRWRIDAHDASAYLYPVALLAAVGALYALRGRWGRGPLVAALFFVGTLSPALGFIDVFPMRFSFVADHFQYMASLGPIVFISALAARHLTAPVSRGAGMAAALVLGLLTYRQGLIYQGPEKLWRDTLAKNPRASIARINLGAILQADGRLDEAEQQYRAALADPECLDRADVLRNLGLSAMRRKDAPAAIAAFEQAAALEPTFAPLLVNLGEALRSAGRSSEAAVYFERAVAAAPHDVIARNNLGSARFEQNRLDEAVAEFQTALTLQPDSAEAHYNLGNALAGLKREAEAQAEYVRALALRPDYVVAHINLANLLAQGGRYDEAIEHLTAALRSDPRHPLAHYSLAYALDRRGRHAEAVEHHRLARALRPDLAPLPGFTVETR